MSALHFQSCVHSIRSWGDTVAPVERIPRACATRPTENDEIRVLWETKRWTDTDGDGQPDRSDRDDDNDGVPDVIDAFPRDRSRSRRNPDDSRRDATTTRAIMHYLRMSDGSERTTGRAMDLIG